MDSGKTDPGVRRVSVKAIDPNKRENVDTYKYQGRNVEVAPVDVSHNEPGTIEMGALKGDTVKPEMLGQVMSSAPQDSGVENGTVEWLMVKKMWANDDAPQFLVSVKSPRATKQVRYDLAGHLLNVS